MAVIRKIKIEDIDALRSALDLLYENAPQTVLAKWALQLAARSLNLAGYDIHAFDAVLHGFAVSEAWQRKEMRFHDVRQAGFKIHQVARDTDDTLLKTALRVAGQAVATAHMREHAMVASDYTVKAVNIQHPGDLGAAAQERKWQIDTLRQELQQLSKTKAEI